MSRSIIQDMLSIRFIIPALMLAGFTGQVNGQMLINQGSLVLENGSRIEVKGNLTSNADITGEGTIVFNGSSAQQVNLNGKSVPAIEINNGNHVSLTGDLVISDNLHFISGKLLLGNHNLRLNDNATVNGQGSGKFPETNGTGYLIRDISANVSFLEIPVGTGNNYHPAFISTSGTYTNGQVSVQVKPGAHPNKPSRSSDYLNCYWSLAHSGITGSVRATGKYETDLTGNENDLRGFTYANGGWSTDNTGISNSVDTTGADVPPTGIDLYAMNRFVYLKSKAYLQGAFNSSTGLMNDNLRTLASFPTTDPYRSAPYNAYFSHTDNTVVETITSPATILGVQPVTDNNIVDWVFIELRNTTVSPGNTIIQTRSALLQRDGDIVDLDGVSPVYFKNLDRGNYTIAVRHRNHLGLSADPAAYTNALTEKNSTPLVDLANASDAQLFGSANVNYAVVSGKNMLYAGNVSGNGVVRYQGTNGPGATNVSDRVALLSDLGNNELNTLSTYQRGDVSMNGITRYQGTNGPGANNVSDRVFILGTVLGNNEIQTKTQALPN